MHRCVARRETDETGHPDIERVVVLDEFLASEGMNDGALQRVGKLKQFGMGASAAAAAEQGDLRRAVEKFGQRIELGLRRADYGPCRQQSRIGGDGTGRRILQRHVAWNDHHCDASLPDGSTNRVLEDERQLQRVGDEFAIVATLREQGFRIGFLEVAGTDLGRGDMRSDGQDWGPASMTIEQPVDEVDVAGAAGTGTDRQLAGKLAFRAGCEGADFLMAHMHPVDDTTRADRLGDRVEAIADDAVDPSDADLLQGFDDEICDGFYFHDRSSCFRSRTMLRRTRSPLRQKSRAPGWVSPRCHSRSMR
ncbi:hypothetical protein AIGOOFII_3450 [Methylobacterium marchantiae]|nr:hypothetical protein AIGOOFII_3450 [Methylobacterium marchantiae]